MERRDIFRRTLEAPKVYTGLQDLLGARSARRRVAAEVLQIEAGDRVLDVGCGPGDILEALPDIDYLGIDYSERYVEAARERFGGKGQFIVADVRSLKDLGHSGFDLAFAIGVLHHLDDESAKRLLRDVAACLRPGGRFVAIDPLIEERQHPVARALALLDRGRHVRRLDGYANLASEGFDEVAVEPRRDLLRIPYSHCVLRAIRGDGNA